MTIMNLEEYKGVYVFAQQVDNELSSIAFELLGKAKELAAPLNTDVTAVLIGSDVKGLVDQLAEYGADKVIVVDDPELKEYRTEPYAHALASVINEYKPEIVLVGATAIGRDLGPRVSARVATGLTADCTVLEIGDFPLNAIPGQEQKHNQLLMTRPAFGGNTIATIACPDNRPQMATVRPGVMQKIDPIAGAKAEVIEYNPGFTPDNKYVEILDVVKELSDTVDIMDAKILVSGGRGVGSAENFKLLQDLADVIGGTVSCSRAVVDNGWLPKELQPLLSVVLVKDISTLRTESWRILRIFRFPSALITTVKRCACRLLRSTVRTEFAFVYCATGTCPAFVLCRSLRTAFWTEVACHRSSARAFPCAWCRFRFRFLCSTVWT